MFDHEYDDVYQKMLYERRLRQADQIQQEKNNQIKQNSALLSKYLKSHPDIIQNEYTHLIRYEDFIQHSTNNILKTSLNYIAMSDFNPVCPDNKNFKCEPHNSQAFYIKVRDGWSKVSGRFLLDELL